MVIGTQKQVCEKISGSKTERILTERMVPESSVNYSIHDMDASESVFHMNFHFCRIASSVFCFYYSTILSEAQVFNDVSVDYFSISN